MVTKKTALISYYLFLSGVFAQSGCEGDTSTYDQGGLTVAFQNLCGKDITAHVDFLDPTNELTWSACLDKCVEKAPLCYGFDFRPPDQPNPAEYSCWLMNASFPESSAITQTDYIVGAGMLSSNTLDELSDDCRSLGLLGCFQKNGQIGTSSVLTAPSPSATKTTSTEKFETPALASQTSTTATTSTTKTSESTATSGGGGLTTIYMTLTAPASSSSTASGSKSGGGGLSTSAKAGIGVGVAVAVLLAVTVGIIFFLIWKKRKAKSSGVALDPNVSEKIVDEDAHWRGRAELPVQLDQLPTAELESEGRGIHELPVLHTNR